VDKPARIDHDNIGIVARIFGTVGGLNTVPVLRENAEHLLGIHLIFGTP